MNTNEKKWFSAKCIFVCERDDTDKLYTYEERITIWEANDFDDAIRLAEKEADEYSEQNGLSYTGSCMAYVISPYVPEHGAEVYSVMRDSDLETDEYIDRFYDTGNERTQEADPVGKLENLLDYEKTLVEALESTRLKIKKLKEA